ncbi:hypothetical protein LQF76_08985 [Gloeomargaritales cyanobacterium VI4D9]|nr:hypothetical protein LQF76_08985 [Gloeomargaritales cyanobacterium VI4D9]
MSASFEISHKIIILFLGSNLYLDCTIPINKGWLEVMNLKSNFLTRSTWVSRIERIVALATVFIGGGFWLIERGHKVYWETTIFQVQTVDFNMLAHTLPTKLSLLLLQNDLLELQKTLDSNYSLFGLVVTDAEGKKILAKSNSKVVLDSFPWQRKLLEEPTSLQDHHFNYLTDPPPVTAQASYTDPYVKKPGTLQKPPGKVIGRIYYIRGIPPSLLEDLQMWVSNPLAEQDAFPLYFNTSLLTVILFVITFIFIEFLINLKQREYEQILKENEQVTRQVLSAEKSILILKNELFRAQEKLVSLEASREESYRELNAIAEEKERLEIALKDISHDNQNLTKMYNETRQRECELTSYIKQLEQMIREQQNSVKTITETQEQIQNTKQDTENRFIQQIRDIVNRNLPSSDEQNMDFEMLIKIFQSGFMPDFTSNVSQVFNPRDPFPRITRMLSRNFDNLKGIENSLKRKLNNRQGSNFDYSFSTTDDRNCINNFLDLLRTYRFFRTLNRVPTENRISATLNDGDPNFPVISDLLRGGWLEFYLYDKVRKFYQQRQRKIVCLSNLKFSTVSESSGEFDLIAFINRQMIVFECKTGDYESFRSRIPRYTNYVRQLDLSPRQFILVAPKLEQQQRQMLSQTYEITFVGLDDLDEALRLAISA